MRHQHVRYRCQEGDRDEVSQRVVGEVWPQGGVDDEAVGCDQDSVAVRRSAGCKLGADQRACTGAVLDDHRLAEVDLKDLGELADGEVHRAARRLGHDHSDRPGWIPDGPLREGGSGAGNIVAKARVVRRVRDIAVLRLGSCQPIGWSF